MFRLFNDDEKKLASLYNRKVNESDLIHWENELNHFCDEFARIYLYGAGKYGKACLNLLKDNGVKVEGVVVTKKYIDYFCDIPVYGVDDFLSICDDRCGVILSLKEVYQEEVKKLLQKKSVRFLPLPDCVLSIEAGLINSNFETLQAAIKEWEKNYIFKRIPKDKWRNILIIQLEVAIGDNIWSSACIRELRRSFPAANIIYIVSDNMKQLVCNCPYVDKIVYYPLKNGNCSYSSEMQRDAERFISENLNDFYPDVAFLLKALPCHPSDVLENVMLCLYSGSFMRIAHAFNIFPYEQLFYKTWKKLFPVISIDDRAEHDVSKDLGLLRICGIPVVDDRMEMWIDQASMEKVKKLYFLNGCDYKIRVAIGVSGRELRRNWPVTKYVRLLSKINKTHEDVVFVIVGGQNAIGEGEFMESSGLPVINLVNKLNLIESGAAIGFCDFYLGSDTSLMHMAAANGIPIIELIANLPDGSDYDQGAPVRTGPWRVHNEVIGPTRALGDCTHLCRKPYTHCMKNISVRRVYEAVLRMIDYVEHKKRDGI